MGQIEVGRPDGRTARTPCSRRWPRRPPPRRQHGPWRAHDREWPGCRTGCSQTDPQTLVARIANSSPVPGGSSTSTTATPPSTLRTAFMRSPSSTTVRPRHRNPRYPLAACHGEALATRCTTLPLRISEESGAQRARFRVFLPQMRTTMDQLVHRARPAEVAASVGSPPWTTWHPRPPRAPDVEAMITNAWLAGRTDRLRVGSLALCDRSAIRRVRAREAVTLDDASGVGSNSVSGGFRSQRSSPPSASGSA